MRPTVQKEPAKWVSGRVWNFNPEDDVRALVIAEIGPNGNLTAFLNESVRNANPDALGKALAAQMVERRAQLARKTEDAKRLVDELKRAGSRKLPSAGSPGRNASGNSHK